MNNLDTFSYFAYGSNLLSKRIHMNNPTAIRKGVGHLNGYRLDFGYWSNQWNGSVATIVPDSDSSIYGCIWELNVSDIPHLDSQEGVKSGIYKPINVSVDENGCTISCRSYELCKLPEKILPGMIWPENRKPSYLYHSIIVNGAIESGLPESYIIFLKEIPHNGFKDTKLSKIMLLDD